MSIWIISIAHGSQLITHELDSKEIAGNLVGISSLRKFQVYLPDEYYEREDVHYPVLYWIPGWGAGLIGDTYKKPLDDAIKSGTIPSTIAVFIDVHEQVWCLNSPVLGNWENFITLELIPFIDREYRTISDPSARALMGHSSGGYTAFILPARNPGIWGSSGGNDPALWGMWAYVRDKEDLNFFPSFNDIQGGYKNLPKEIGAYKSVTNWYVQDLIQFGTAFSPNPDDPLFCDLPVNADGEWIPEVREKWSKYDLSNPESLTNYSQILKELLSITIVTPTGGGEGAQNRIFIEQLLAAGIHITQLDMPGGHGDYVGERFIAMAEQILNAMVGAEVSVSPQGSMVVTWGAIRQGY
jgi:S-formylglutathione hydrolase FrmB